jgi:arylsulfatase A-like enzyme
MRPNIVVIMADDLGFSDLGCYGGEIDTPNIDALAAVGVRMTQFYTTARCSPSRASLLTGLHQHQVGIGVLNSDDRPVGYGGDLTRNGATMAEILRGGGYATGAVGKWHLSSNVFSPSDSWPTRRGFDYFYGNLTGCGSFFDPGTLTRGEKNVEDEARADPEFYYTDAITDEARRFINRHASKPFFLYVAYTAPHFPLHARENDIDAYKGRFDEGWDVLRARRWSRQKQMGIADGSMPLSERDPDNSSWASVKNKAWQTRRMEVYAAQVTAMDRGVGVIRADLERAGLLDDTLIVFLSDNGASPEELPILDLYSREEMVRHATRDGRPVRYGNDPQTLPGGEDTFASYGRQWANLSNTPFRLYKKWNHEGGTAAPLIFHWPNGALPGGEICSKPLQLVSLLPALLEAAEVPHPGRLDGREVLKPESSWSLNAVRDGSEGEPALFFEHVGNAAIRKGDWKLVREFRGAWELYDIRSDRSEKKDLASERPELVAALAGEWEAWADRVGVIPFDRIVTDYETRGLTAAHAAG